MRSIGVMALAVGLVAAAEGRARATPSTQVWIPSPDVQKFGTLHLNSDVYSRLKDEPGGTRKPTILMLGPTVGVLPFEKVQAEVGFDLMFQGDSNLDRNPFYFHSKVGTPEKSMFGWSPSIAVGIYNVGTEPTLTGQNIGYGLVGKTLPVVGRLSAGYFYGRKSLLVDENGAAANQGLLLSWDRTMSEISDKLWAAIDYQGGDSALGAVNAGVAWAFSEKVSVIAGYDYYLNPDVAGRDTFTLQLDINL